MGHRGKPIVVELFAGAGLFGAAFASEGFRARLAVEFDHAAAETYQKNLGNHIVVADVQSIVPDRARCDVLIAGPPCQCFSTLNRSRSGDARQYLSLCIADWAKACKPSIIVIENVAQYLKAPVWSKLMRRLRGLGYSVSSTVAQAADFAVPQMRSRSFTFAALGELPELEPPSDHASTTVRQAWEGLPAEPDDQNSHFAPKPSPIALARMKVIPRGGDKRDVLRKRPDLVPRSWYSVQSEATDVWGRMKWDQPANTIRTCFQNASKGRYIHPEQNRVISLREAARLQGIPDDFQFCGLPTQVARQIGNAVPYPLGRAVATAVRNSL